ncbi:MAG: hypothetical protein ACRC23_01635 [Aeromonas jandaei]
MGWIKIRAIRKEKVFTATVGETFNIEAKTGVKNWNDPKFMISIRDYSSSGGFVDTRLNIDNIGYPNFRVTNNGDFASGIVIDIYVTEGDADTINNTNGSSFRKMAEIGSNAYGKAMFTLSPSNGFSATLPISFKGNYKVFYSFKRTNFPRNMFGYTFNSNVSGRTFSVSLTAKLARMIHGTSTSTSISLPRPMFCGVSYAGLTFGSTNDQTPNYVTGTFNINGTHTNLTCIVAGGWGFQTFTCDNYYYYAQKNNIRDFTFSFVRISGNLGNVSNSMITYFYCNTSTYDNVGMNDFEVNCIVIWGV